MKNAIIFIGLVLFVIAASLWIHKETNPRDQQIPSLTPFTVSLDWTPNTNHTGMYVALAKGWYKAEGLRVTILPYSSAASPDVLTATGKADVAVSATEGVLADAATGNPVVSIAGIVQHNTSGFITLKDTGITRPKNFDGKIYGGGGSPAESAIIGALIKKDGGTGTFKNVSLDVEAMQALESKKVDFVWVFEGWEVIQAKRAGYKVNYFPSIAYGIADYYTPVFIASPKEIKEKSALLRKFMAATKKGYEYARKYPRESAKILIQSAPKGTFPDTGLVFASQEFLSAHYADKEQPWGMQTQKGWHDYPQFLIDSKAVLDGNGKAVTGLNLDSLYTNDFVK